MTNSDPRVIYQVECPICGAILYHDGFARWYRHPDGQAVYQSGTGLNGGNLCPNNGKSFSFEQPVVMEVNK